MQSSQEDKKKLTHHCSAETSSWNFLKQKYLDKGFDIETVSTILHSWRKGTKKNYAPYISQWVQYCKENNYNHEKAPVSFALSFLQNLFKKGHKYGQINTACSTLSLIIDVDGANSFGKLPVVKKFMKGIFEQKPVFPKYQYIWDVNKIFDFFRSLPEIETLDLKMLTFE